MKMKTITKFLTLVSVLLSFSLKVSGQQTAVLLQNNANHVQIARYLSADGRFVTGQTTGAPGIRQAFVWDIESGMVITPLGGSVSNGRPGFSLIEMLSEGYEVTSGGRVIGDFADPDFPFFVPEDDAYINIRSAGFWENGVWTGLGLGLGNTVPVNLFGGSSANTVSADGNTIAGFIRTRNEYGREIVRPYSWTYNETTGEWDGTMWAVPENVWQGAAIVTMSADGKTAAGWANLIGGSARIGIYWTSPEEYTIFYGDPGMHSQFYKMSANGRFLGFSKNGVAGVYDREEGIYHFIPRGRAVTGVSNDGLAVGFYEVVVAGMPRRKGFVWSQALGFMDFNEFRLTYLPPSTGLVIPAQMANMLQPTSTTSYTLNHITPDGLSILMNLGSRAMIIKYSEPIVAIPSPRNLRIEVNRVARNEALLTWDAPAMGDWEHTLTGFEIFRNNVLIASVAADVLTYLDIDIPAGFHYYEIRAIYENGAVSRRTDEVMAVIVDNYDLPFFEDFSSRTYRTNFWTPFPHGLGMRNPWAFSLPVGAEGTGGVRAEVRSRVDVPQMTLTSKPLDATTAASVYLSYMFTVPRSAVKDTLFVDVSTNGTTWTKVHEYVITSALPGWKLEVLDISDIAAGELINIRFRFGTVDEERDLRTVYFDNVGVFTTPPAGADTPSDIIHRRVGDNIELAWKVNGTYGLSHMFTLQRRTAGNAGENIMAAALFDTDDLAIYAGLNLTSISTFVNQHVTDQTVPTTLRLAVFVDGVRIVSQDVESFTPNAWNTFALNTPVAINSVERDLKFGIEVMTHDDREMPLTVGEAGRFTAGKGDLFSYDGGVTWLRLSDLPEEQRLLRANWSLIGNVSAGASPSGRNELLRYNIYRNGEKLNSSLVFGQRFVVDLEEGCFTVRAFSFENGLSGLSAAHCIELFTITASVSGNGTIEPSGAVTVLGGDNQTFTFTSNEAAAFSANYSNRTAIKVLINGINNAEAVEAGTYTFTNVTENHTIEVIFEEMTTSVEDAASGVFGVYPNPVVNEMRIQTEQTILQVVVFDLQGRVVLRQQGSSRVVDMQMLSPGIYTVQIYTETGVTPVRVVKQ